MADYTFYTNPMSRGQIVRWALHEAGADYEQQIVEYGPTEGKPAAFIAANPMGKVPTLVHHHGDHDHAHDDLDHLHDDAGHDLDDHVRYHLADCLYFAPVSLFLVFDSLYVASPFVPPPSEQT